MDSYRVLVACERLGAHTVEVIESDIFLENPLTGVANTTDRNTVQCFLGDDEFGDHDCEISPEEFSKRLKVSAAIFGRYS